MVAPVTTRRDVDDGEGLKDGLSFLLVMVLIAFGIGIVGRWIGFGAWMDTGWWGL